MGSIGYTIQVTNRGAATCTLSGTPRLYYTATGGSVVAIPVIATTPHAKPFVVAVGRTAETNVLIVDGYGGYPMNSPHCIHPVVYRGISLRAGGGRLALPGFELDVTCDDVRVAGWNLVK
jgi:hypothetical protein